MCCVILAGGTYSIDVFLRNNLDVDELPSTSIESNVRVIKMEQNKSLFVYHLFYHYL